MAQIRPFQALRFRPAAGEISRLTCPPYDIISEEQRLNYIAVNEHNIIRLELPREGEDPYEEAGRLLREWKAQGILAKDEKPGFYLYEEEFTVSGVTRKVKGLLGQVKLSPFSEGVILPHEFTLSKAKADRFNLMKATFCNFSPIYSLYMDNGQTRPLIDELSSGTPEVEFTDESGITHRLWVVTDPAACEALCVQFADRKLYIADGHHRYETALAFRDWARENGLADPDGATDTIMMMLVDMEHPGLLVLPTHRLVRDLPEFDPDKAMEKCEAFFTVEPQSSLDGLERTLAAKYDAGQTAFGFYCGKAGWTLLTLRDSAVMDELLPDLSRASRELDVTVLHTLILERLFGIDKENMANQKNLTYVKSVEEALGAVDRGQAQCAFILNPTRVTEIRDVAAAGEKMPQKSTYFYPKLITGLVFNELR